MLGTMVAFLGSGLIALALIWALVLAIRGTEPLPPADDSSVPPRWKSED
jgi:hypothetical protein